MPKPVKPREVRKKPESVPALVSSPTALRARPFPLPTLSPLLLSLILIAVMILWTLQPTLRMARIWLDQDGFKRHSLGFNVEGVPAKWGYAAWAGVFDEPRACFGSDYHGLVAELPLKNLPPVLNHNIGGGPLVINKAVFSSGVGTHAPGKIAFSLDGKFSRFSCRVGLDATSTNSRGGIYAVIADGREIFRSPKLYPDADPYLIDVSVAGVRELILDAVQTEFSSTGNNVDWVDLHFTP